MLCAVEREIANALEAVRGCARDPLQSASSGWFQDTPTFAQGFGSSMPLDAVHRAPRRGGSEMETNGTTRAGLPKRWLGAAGLIGAGLLAGGILAGSQIAGAATGSSSSGSKTASSVASSSNSSSSSNANGGSPMDPAKMTHGPGETLLTGTAAEKATAAAKAAVPGATIIRVETDSDGAAYEAHMQKADGTYVTVEMDSNFKVTKTVSGFGPGPRGSSGSQGSNGGA
jgi:hypothetical protein